MLEMAFWFLVCFVCVYLTGTLIGYGLHKSLHQKWMGRFYEAHMNHHQIQYPMGDLLSEKYREPPRKDNTVYFFTPFIVAFAISLGLVLPWKYWIFSMVMIAIFGYAHDYFHTQFHLKNSWLLRFRFFHELRRRHFVHHKHMQRNIGIYHFFWDRVFSTYLHRAKNNKV